ncbi:MAG: hypothetical protein ACTTK1_07540, partial [Candidatus Cryptobacteroides sp.]
TKVGGSTLSSHSVLAAHLTYISSQEVYVNLGSVPGGEVFLPKKNGGIVSSMSVTLFALPVNYSRVYLDVDLDQGGRLERHTLELRLKDSGSWLTFDPYKKYDIRVGAGKDWNVELNAADKSFPYTGGTGTINITSRKTYYSQSESLPWKVEGYCTTGPDGAFTDPKPDWLTLSKTDGSNITDLTSSSGLNVSVSAQTLTTTHDAHTIALRAKSEVGEQSDPIDLSKVPIGTSPNPLFSIDNGASASTYAGNPMNTANCYVVTRPGWYKIPVVYGNAIKNGNDNTSAYTSSKSGNNVLQNFIRHDKQPIIAPWIKDNGTNFLDNSVAELLWQDQPNLVKNIQLQSDKQYIVFHVSQLTIHEGNAVIALKENNNPNANNFWSWHIWVTASNMKTINVKNNKDKAPSRPGQDNFNFLSENLGSCYDGYVTGYPESKVWVKVSNGRQTNVIKITRLAGPTTTSTKYNNPYYQWGRKDPMLPSAGPASNQNKVWYDNAGRIQSFFFQTAIWSSNGGAGQAKAEIAETIKYPHTFNTSVSMDYLYYNLWDTKCNEISNSDISTARFESTTKSVYDPCPPGFCLPPNGAFTGFTITGKDSYTSSDWNVSGSFDKGWHFRTVLKDESGGETIFFPASGYRYYSTGALFGVGEFGYFVSSVPQDTNYGCILVFLPFSVSPLDRCARSFGHALRPVKE